MPPRITYSLAKVWRVMWKVSVTPAFAAARFQTGQYADRVEPEA